MPLVRIDINESASAERIRIVSRAVYNAMVDVANVPANDKFQIITCHPSAELVYPEEGYLGISYTPDIIFIQVTWLGGRSIEVKKKFYKKIADDIHDQAGVRREDIFINLVEVNREDWSFGNGEMQYGPK